MSQTALAGALDRAQSTISTWIAGNATPAPEVVFAIERHLQAAPGALSQHLGYVPVSTDGEPVIDAIARDRRLSAEQRETLIRLFQEYAGL